MDKPTSSATVLLEGAEVQQRVVALAQRLAPQLDDDTVAICLLVGGLWFAADLTRALASEGRVMPFDALWLSSYGDERTSVARCERLAGPQRSVRERSVLVIDDVVDSGASLREAERFLRNAGAAQVITAVFARKPWPTQRAIEPDYVAWEAPAKFLVGYGMDDAGGMRGLPWIGALRS